MFLDEFRASLRHVRRVQRDTVAILLFVFSAVVIVGAALARAMADPATGLSAEALTRLSLIDLGMLLIAGGFAVLLAGWRWRGAYDRVVDGGVRAGDHIERLERRVRGRAASRDSELLARLVQDDTNMPGINGFETAARIRKDEGDGPYVPIVAVSEEGSGDEHARCLAAGINELLAKPVDAEQLAAVVDRLVLPSSATVAARRITVAKKTNVRSTAPGLDTEILERLERIQRVSDQGDLIRQMVDTFEAKASAAFEAFELAIEEGDPTLVRLTADRLRRSCATLGVVRMERLCNLMADDTRGDRNRTRAGALGQARRRVSKNRPSAATSGRRPPARGARLRRLR